MELRDNVVSSANPNKSSTSTSNINKLKNKINVSTKYGVSPFLKEAQVSQSPAYENEVRNDGQAKGIFDDWFASGEQERPQQPQEWTVDRMQQNTSVVDTSYSGKPEDWKVDSSPVKETDKSYVQEYQEKYLKNSLGGQAHSKYFSKDGGLAYADTGSSGNAESFNKYLDTTMNAQKSLNQESDNSKIPVATPTGFTTSERHGTESTFTTQDTGYDRTIPFHKGKTNFGWYDDNTGGQWKVGTSYTISGPQPGGGNRWGNKTKADIVNSQQGARKYNDIVARWQRKFLANALTDKVTSGQINQFVKKEIAKIEKWNISSQEKGLYISDLELRQKQLLTVIGKDNLSGLGARKDPMDKFKDNPGAIYTFTKGAKGTAPGKVLTYKDLGLGY
jgi:hypothetical protein